MFDLENLFKRFSFEKNDKRFRICNLIILIVGLSLYLLNNYFLHEINWFFMFYFNDFLAIVVLLSFLNLVYPYKLTNVWLIIIVTILASFVWEYVILLYFLEGKINTSI